MKSLDSLCSTGEMSQKKFSLCSSNDSGMLEQAWPLCDAMIKELAHIRNRKLEPVQEAEQSFQMAVIYWQKLLSLIPDDVLQEKSTAIVFFKQLKPLFTTEIAYFRLLFQAYLFIPLDTEDFPLYWLREWDRTLLFLNKHAAFYNYFQRGDCSQDLNYFTLATCNPQRFLIDNPDHYQEGFCNDLLLSMLLAMVRYQQYIKHQLNLQSHS